MSNVHSVDDGSRLSVQSPLSVLGIVAAAITLLWYGPVWYVLVGLALGGIYVFGTPLLAVVFGQTALVAVGSPSPEAIILVESELFFVLLSYALSSPETWTNIVPVAVFVPLLGGFAWLSLNTWNVAPLLVGATLLAGSVIVGYLLHRYLLIELGIVTEDANTDGDQL